MAEIKCEACGCEPSYGDTSSLEYVNICHEVTPSMCICDECRASLHNWMFKSEPYFQYEAAKAEERAKTMTFVGGGPSGGPSGEFDDIVRRRIRLRVVLWRDIQDWKQTRKDTP